MFRTFSSKREHQKVQALHRLTQLISQWLHKFALTVGLYLNPPETALVLCVAEKSEIRLSTEPLQSVPEGPACQNVRCTTIKAWHQDVIRGL